MKNLVIALFLSVLVGCATGYQSSGFSGGYTETWLAEDAIKVTFVGNGYTRGDRASDFSLLRVAEIAAQRGYPYFVLIAENSAVSTSKTPESYNISTYGNSGKVTQTGGWIISKPSTTNVAKLLKEKPSNFGGIVYSVDFVCNNMIRKYDLNAGDVSCGTTVRVAPAK
jgi:hypothetical protein